MEALRERLIQSILTNGRESQETIRLSQMLDTVIVKEMQRSACNVNTKH